jgi:RNA polymerase sigma factor (sigma-70 family)
MSPFDPKKPSPGDEANRNQAREITTTGGVKVIVSADPPPARRWRREPPEASPRVVVFPPGQTAEERAACIDSIARQYGKFIRETLETRGDVLKESKKDLRQEVILILCAYVDENDALPGSPEAWLRDVIDKKVRNHKLKKRTTGGAEVDEEIGDAPDPEAAAELAEEREKLRGYLDRLPQVEAEVVRLVDLDNMTIEQAAKQLDRANSTVADRLARGRDRLRELGLESQRAAELRRSAASLPAHLAPAPRR